eukprot:403350434
MAENREDYGDIISTEVLIIPQNENQKQPVPEKGNLQQLAEDVSDRLVDGIDVVADKLHDMVIGNDKEMEKDYPLKFEAAPDFSVDIKTKNEQLEDYPKHLPHLKHEVNFEQAHQTLKDLHLAPERISYLSSLNPELMVSQTYQKPDETYPFENLARQYLDAKELERAYFPMTFDFSDKSDRNDISYQARNARVKPIDYKTIRERRLMNKMQAERWRRPQRKHESTHLDQILDPAEIKAENERLYQQALKNEITQVAPEIQTKFTREEKEEQELENIADRIEQERAKQKQDFLHYTPKVVTEDVRNIQGKLLDVRGIDFLKVEGPLKHRGLRQQNKEFKIKIRKTPHESHLHDLSSEYKRDNFDIKSLRQPKLPYLGQLRRQNQYRFHKEQKMLLDPEHIPELGMSLRQGLLEEMQEQKRQEIVQEIIEKEMTNENKPEQPHKPSGFVGMYS